MRQLVECVPNFSEGRRAEVIAQIAAEITAVPGISLLDQESDSDHNRSVLTFVGPPEAVLEAAFCAIRAASTRIDLDAHEGAHPRIGATDVVPFIPIEGVAMADCITLARRLGQRVGEELGIPVYLYEAAATRPENENLANIRQGEYEGLKTAIESDPRRAPDFGPARLGKAGATVIGARAPLVAFNAYLTTANVEIARRIARAIRHQTGGLRYVKALGLLVNGKAQVSMNLTDTAQTPIFRVVEMVRREAQRYGVGIESTELIGLIPQKALFDSAQWYLQIDNFQPAQVLEQRLNEAGGESSFLNALASAEPTPGGGSAAAYAGAMAAALVAMVGRVTVGRKKYAGVSARMAEIVTEAERLRAQLDAGVALDAQAFDAVMAATRLPKDSEAQQAARAAALESATLAAAEVPLAAAHTVLAALALAVEVAEHGNLNALSDAGSAGALAESALFAAGLNVRINAKGLADRAAAASLLQRLTALETQAAALRARLHSALRQRGEFDLPERTQP